MMPNAIMQPSFVSRVGGRWAAWAPRLKSVLRIVAALMFMSAGSMKLFGFPALPGMPVPLVSEMGLASILETFGGAMLLLGLFTRPVALLLAGEMAIAYFQVHFPMGFWPTLNNGQPAILYCFIWLYLSAAGPGPWSVDAKRGK